MNDIGKHNRKTALMLLAIVAAVLLLTFLGMPE
jgi:hypothetical protein